MVRRIVFFFKSVNVGKPIIILMVVVMSQIHFTVAQIEAFVAVCETNNVLLAAKKLHKNRTTISELISTLEINLGYELFVRSKKPLVLTDEGKQLYTQACLFLQQAHIFDQFAMQLPKQMKQTLTICYDCFIPSAFIKQLIAFFAQQNMELNLLNIDRQQAELQLLAEKADIGIYPAVNRMINAEFQWYALGAIELGIYAHQDFFAKKIARVSLLELASSKQLIPFAGLPQQLSQMIKVSDKLQIITNIELLKDLINEKQGWSMLPTHLFTNAYKKVCRFDSEQWDKGAILNIVAIWKPTTNGQLAALIQQLAQLYTQTRQTTRSNSGE
ncbi:LysR family transcriptional regulator [Orbus hercynius]|uniref:LysR family transcriptional regulator n=1 Tax=Orbus hercynius TaxID=593135 RepID=A0A495RJI8_9GAMM|nr:LysR family transcriptional regulator [Orbus hercynius]RKS87529.1 LysR family transcriptional regulator [Orbus hercynius]